MKKLYYEDVDDIALDMIEIMIKKFSKHDIILSESQIDEIYDMIQSHLREKHSCYEYRNYN